MPEPTLTDFLLARINEDEAAARKADKFRWDRPSDAPWRRAEQLAETGSKPQAHIARWNPARVLAECEAKRRIIGMYERAHDAETTDRHLWAAYREERTAFQRALEALALPYADHPDYDESWRP
jgi:hypothetical protein